jgi:hypothetical protein
MDDIGDRITCALDISCADHRIYEIALDLHHAFVESFDSVGVGKAWWWEKAEWRRLATEATRLRRCRNLIEPKDDGGAS